MNLGVCVLFFNYFLKLFCLMCVFCVILLDGPTTLHDGRLCQKSETESGGQGLKIGYIHAEENGNKESNIKLATF